jgi:predicted nucleic acid-binding protein
MSRRHRWRLVIDTSVVIRGARAFRQRPPEPKRPELILLEGWIEDERLFDWLFSDAILEEYRQVLRRLKVPPGVAGRFVNLLRAGGTTVSQPVTGTFSPDPLDDPFYQCALAGNVDAIVTDNVKDFPPVKGRARPQILTPAETVVLVFPKRK